MSRKKKPTASTLLKLNPISAILYGQIYAHLTNGMTRLYVDKVVHDSLVRPFPCKVDLYWHLEFLVACGLLRKVPKIHFDDETYYTFPRSSS